MGRIDRINSSQGEIINYTGRAKFKARINSKVSEDGIVGLDLMDGFPINFLAHVDNIEFPICKSK